MQTQIERSDIFVAWPPPSRISKNTPLLEHDQKARALGWQFYQGPLRCRRGQLVVHAVPATPSYQFGLDHCVALEGPLWHRRGQVPCHCYSIAHVNLDTCIFQQRASGWHASLNGPSTACRVGSCTIGFRTRKRVPSASGKRTPRSKKSANKRCRAKEHWNKKEQAGGR
jgi:hypothetical protein